VPEESRLASSRDDLTPAYALPRCTLKLVPQI
jgi:hypothetical protein